MLASCESRIIPPTGSRLAEAATGSGPGDETADGGGRGGGVVARSVTRVAYEVSRRAADHGRVRRSRGTVREEHGKYRRARPHQDDLAAVGRPARHVPPPSSWLAQARARYRRESR